MSSPVETIKERLSIVDVVGAYLKLEKSGSNLKAKCPFHSERTASFFVSPTRGSYYCFGCGAKGDIFSFVQAFEGLDFMGALKSLATRAGVELVPEDPKLKDERERLYTLLETATLFFQIELGKEKKFSAYLKGRGIQEDTINLWRLGYAPDMWRSCLEHCREKGFTPTELERAGLTKTEKGKTYDRFRGRIMFPIFDSSGRVIAFSGRLLGKESEHAPKYLNSPETQVFSKSRTLYGFDKAKIEIRKKDYSVLVEGQMDLLMCHQAGLRNTVASSGTSFTEEQLTLLKRLSKRLLMVFDSDKAGIQASLKSATLALSRGLEVKVAALPSGSDPAELIAKDKGAFTKCLKSSSHIVDFYLNSIVREKLEDRDLARAIRDRLLPYVEVLESTIEKDHFIKKISEVTGIREDAIREDMGKITTPEREKFSPLKENSLNPRKHLVERLVAGLWFWQKKLETPLLDISHFSEELHRILGEKETKELFNQATEMSDELIFQAESYYGGSTSLQEASRDLLVSLEEDVLRESLAQAMKNLSLAERAKDGEKKKEILGKCGELTKRLNALKEGR